jgi:hypothetical protein
VGTQELHNCNAFRPVRGLAVNLSISSGFTRARVGPGQRRIFAESVLAWIDRFFAMRSVWRRNGPSDNAGSNRPDFSKRTQNH